MILIITNVLCYHQVYVADDLYSKYGDFFAFVQMREPLQWRVAKEQEGFVRPYLLTYTKEKNKVLNLVKSADVIIYGEAPLKLIRHKSKNCLLFRMSENIFKDTQFSLTLFEKCKRFLAYKYLKLLTNNDHSFLLACGGFAYNDYFKLGIFRNRALKWGYFPYIPNLKFDDIENKFSSEKMEIVWASRLVEYKKPLYLLTLVKYLLSKGVKKFHLTIIGDSTESQIDYYKQISEDVQNNNLGEFVTLLGSVNAKTVFEYYKKSHIALFTADKSEGWSVGINEAMSCGCAVICSNGIGAVPFLVNKTNGIIYNYDDVDELCKSIEMLLTDKELIKKYSFEGFKSIREVWNHENASNKLSILIDSYLQNGSFIPFKSGPCSVASVIDYDFYKEQ